MMGRWVRRISIAVLVLAVLYVPLVGVGGGLLLAWSLTPGPVDWVLSHAAVPTDPYEIGYRGNPKLGLGLDFTTIEYPTELGPIEAWRVPAAKRSRTWAIFIHGIGGARENGYRQLSILQLAGIPTLLIMYRNDVGAPPGRPPFRSFGLSEWHDLDSAVGWMLANGADHVVLVADSMGGGLVGQFLAHSPRAGVVEALVLDAPAVDFNTVADWALDQYHLPFGDELAGIATRVASIWAPEPLQDANVFAAVADFSGPVFIAHGTADQFVPFSSSVRLVAARKGPTIFLPTDADHLHSYRAEPQRYRAELLAFLAALPKN